MNKARFLIWSKNLFKEVSWDKNEMITNCCHWGSSHSSSLSCLALHWSHLDKRTVSIHSSAKRGKTKCQISLICDSKDGRNQFTLAKNCCSTSSKNGKMSWKCSHLFKKEEKLETFTTWNRLKFWVYVCFQFKIMHWGWICWTNTWRWGVQT